MNQQETTTKISVDKEYRKYDYSKNFDKTLTEEQEEEDPTNCSSKLLEHQSQLESRLLTCEDLINLDEIEPRWRYIRIGLLIGFGIIFFGLLAACIVYIIVGEKCPSVPKLPFWKSTVGYWLDVFAFKDSSGDLVGDLNGLTSEVDYIKTVVGAGYVILGPITKGFYTNSYNMLGLVEDYEQLDEAVGTMADFRKSRYGNRLDVNISHQKYYSVFEYPSIDLDLTSAKTQKAIFNVIHFWMKEGIDGILLDNAAFFVEEEEEGTQSNLSSTWLENCPNSQLYRNGSVKFVEGVREEMNKWIKESGKEKLLAVNSGDTGCGVGDNPDPMLMFRDVADLIISREFVWGRDSDKEILGLTTSTVHIPPYGDTLQLATTLLLPGLPVIYYGTEIDVNRVTLHYLPQSIYPKGKTYNDEPFDKYSSVLSHMPMPWDFNGKRFSATINDSRFRDYLNEYNNKKVVEAENLFPLKSHGIGI
ncbi:solute carrier family 3 (neutral and basic amino acid transporter), member 1 [Schistosoma bovis]|uniref:Solute carrier family 3 (Neutral and basic amino acid transporter), member 1 n=1 Tax=Schistosoma bovis TaxID=6184 RepID=A0A430PY40_SCHBO|nr:solute carrier family 3 (neutral and basic amino acid transporter), member 1 [Schistosoma bovis]